MLTGCPSCRHVLGWMFPYVQMLIEHQSQSDRLMPLRSLDYLVQIYRYQVRE